MRQTRSLGISSPEGRQVYELYISVDSKPMVLAKLATIMGEKNIDILSGSLQCSDDMRTGYDIFYLEMAGATVKPKELVESLKKLDFVKDARIEARTDVKFETMMFPLTRSGHTRVFVLSAEGWAALIDSILKTFGTPGGVILHNQGVTVGEEIMDSIRTLFHVPAPVEQEIANLKAYFGAVGLGVLELSGDFRGLKVVIDQPVTSGSKKGVVDQFLVGVVRGALSKTYSSDYVVQNLAMENGKIRFDLLPDGSGNFAKSA